MVAHSSLGTPGAGDQNVLEETFPALSSTELAAGGVCAGFSSFLRSSCLGGACAALCAPYLTEVGVVRSPKLAFPWECQQTRLWGTELEPVLWQVIDTSTAENGLRGVPMLPIETLISLKLRCTKQHHFQ